MDTEIACTLLTGGAVFTMIAVVVLKITKFCTDQMLKYDEREAEIHREVLTAMEDITKAIRHER